MMTTVFVMMLTMMNILVPAHDGDEHDGDYYGADLIAKRVMMVLMMAMMLIMFLVRVRR